METPVYDRILYNLRLSDNIIFGYTAERELMGFGNQEYNKSNLNLKRFEIIESLRECRLLVGDELEEVYIKDAGVYTRAIERLEEHIIDNLENAKRESRIYKRVVNFREIIVNRKGKRHPKRLGYRLSQFAIKSTGLYDNYKRASSQAKDANKKVNKQEIDYSYIPDGEEKVRWIAMVEQAIHELNQPVTEAQYLDIYAIVLDRLLMVVQASKHRLIKVEPMQPLDDLIKGPAFDLDTQYEIVLYLYYSGIYDHLEEKIGNNKSKIAKAIAQISKSPATSIRPLLSIVQQGYNKKTKDQKLYERKYVENTLNALRDTGFDVSNLNKVYEQITIE